MKLIVAIIPPERLEAVKNQLAAVEVHRLTVADIQGFGTSQPNVEGKGREVTMNLTRRVQLMIGVNEEFLEPTIQAIRGGVCGESDPAMGDGKIFVLPLHDCIRIRTGERGGEAI